MALFFGLSIPAKSLALRLVTSEWSLREAFRSMHRPPLIVRLHEFHPRLQALHFIFRSSPLELEDRTQDHGRPECEGTDWNKHMLFAISIMFGKLTLTFLARNRK